jgi:aspartate aminotransferase-like enzyme
VRAGVQALGLRLWADSGAIKADTVTAVEMPRGVDEAAVRALARAESGVMLAGGQGELRGRVLQIGHMGPAAYPLSPVIALAALGRALRRLGRRRTSAPPSRRRSPREMTTGKVRGGPNFIHEWAMWAMERRASV